MNLQPLEVINREDKHESATINQQVKYLFPNQ